MNDQIKTHELAGQFNTLTPEKVIHSVESAGHTPSGRVAILNSYENRVYRIELENGDSLVGKYYRPGRWRTETILEEHRFLRELADEEIPVAVPLALQNGQTIDEIQGIRFSLFPRVLGRSPQELNEESLRRVGHLIARIHNVGARNEAAHRIQLTPDTYGRQNLEYLLENNHIPVEAAKHYELTVLGLLERIEPMFREVSLQRIHGDCHFGNLIETQKGITFLDFDDMVMGPVVQDIWMLVPSIDAHGLEQRKILLEAYQEFREFDATQLRLIEPLRALRFIHYSTWIARRFEDPAFQRTFSYFGTLQYWQDEINDLREQIARIDSYYC
ncbi:MAG: serine/threonine protein kinase [Deltaproteobacteria bacterium]|nr:serine/threonine protein kinase [Deltaproteobacteria bacterium]MBN2674569.1 serine/threonine protein kinase [Deltaproteobacteria bacterium]